MILAPVLYIIQNKFPSFQNYLNYTYGNEISGIRRKLHVYKTIIKIKQNNIWLYFINYRKLLNKNNRQ